MKLSVVLSFLFILPITLTGCGPAASKPSPDSSGSNAVSEVENSKDQTLSFGEANTWDGGLLVKVSKPRAFNPSPTALSGPMKHNVMFTVKIVNKTGEAVDPSLFLTTLQSGNKEAAEVFDTEKGFNGPPMTPLLNGREAKFKVGFNVKNPDDLVLQVAPDAGVSYEPAIYTQ